MHPGTAYTVAQEYEARLNPFEEFKQAEAHRGRARLPVHDRALLTGPRLLPILDYAVLHELHTACSVALCISIACTCQRFECCRQAISRAARKLTFSNASTGELSS